MLILTAIIVFLYGIAIGSFLNVCIYRLPKGESVVVTASHCPECGKGILKRDLVPLLGYFMLRGKCRNCEAKISPLYPTIELLNGVLYLILFFIYGLSALFVFYAVLSSVLVVIAFVDFKHQEIPDETVIITLIIGVLYHIYGFSTMGMGHWQSAVSAIIGFVAASGILLIIGMIAKGGMGGGDIKMMAVFGLCIGWGQILLSLFIASLYGSVVGGMLMLRKKAGLKSAVPFGPFLALGIFTMICVGDGMIRWYVSLFNG